MGGCLKDGHKVRDAGRRVEVIPKRGKQAANAGQAIGLRKHGNGAITVKRVGRVATDFVF